MKTIENVYIVITVFSKNLSKRTTYDMKLNYSLKLISYYWQIFANMFQGVTTAIEIYMGNET